MRPGNLGDTHFWFGNFSGRIGRRRRKRERQRQMAEMLQKQMRERQKAQKEAQRKLQKAVLPKGFRFKPAPRPIKRPKHRGVISPKPVQNPFLSAQVWAQKRKRSAVKVPDGFGPKKPPQIRRPPAKPPAVAKLVAAAMKRQTKTAAKHAPKPVSKTPAAPAFTDKQETYIRACVNNLRRLIKAGRLTTVPVCGRGECTEEEFRAKCPPPRNI